MLVEPGLVCSNLTRGKGGHADGEMSFGTITALSLTWENPRVEKKAA